MEEDAGVARIEEILGPVLRDHGLELVDLEWRGHRPRGILKVFVDKPGGVGIADCERLSREIGDVIDAEDLIAGAYDLEVSSPGLDRLLRTEREYRWAVGKTLRCRLVDGAEVRGRLLDVSESDLVVEAERGAVFVRRADVVKARLVPDVPWPRQG